MKTVEKMIKHLHWANHRILDALRTAEEEHQQAKRLFTHVLYAEKVWITRLQGKDNSPLLIWPETEVSYAECAELIKQNNENFNTILQDLANKDLEQLIPYTNSKGQAFMTSIRDILTHVALHGQYHRGQINTRLRLEGMEPVNTDFITFVR